jgi:hypothetical protein
VSSLTARENERVADTMAVLDASARSEGAYLSVALAKWQGANSREELAARYDALYNTIRTKLGNTVARVAEP